MQTMLRYMRQGSKLWLFSVLLCGSSLYAQVKNGFDLQQALIPIDQIISGGPAKDGIPAIDRPQFVSAAKAAFLKPEDQVLGVQVQGMSRAYPLRILNWHEVVNDQFGTEPVTITYCPLCGTGVVFSRLVNGKVLSFGVSGLLYNNDVLLYDRQTNSLWSQLMAQAISGPLKGHRLNSLVVTHSTWADWQKMHATTQVLMADTNSPRPYDRNPYAGYDTSSEIMFPMQFRSAGFHPKERVLGIVKGSKAKAYPFVELAKTNGILKDDFAGIDWTIRFDKTTGRATLHDDHGVQSSAVVGYWFAWYAFHPNTEVFHAATPRLP